MSEAIASKEARLAAYNANIAAADKDPQLSPETGKPLSKVNTIRFGAGFLCRRSLKGNVIRSSRSCSARMR